LTDVAKLELIAESLSSPFKVVIISEYLEVKEYPAWTSTCSAANAGLMIELAARSLGYGAKWTPLDYAPGKIMRELLKLKINEVACGLVDIGHERL
jgi:hypothetical protein